MHWTTTTAPSDYPKPQQYVGHLSPPQPPRSASPTYNEAVWQRMQMSPSPQPSAATISNAFDYEEDAVMLRDGKKRKQPPSVCRKCGSRRKFWVFFAVVIGLCLVLAGIVVAGIEGQKGSDESGREKGQGMLFEPSDGDGLNYHGEKDSNN